MSPVERYLDHLLMEAIRLRASAIELRQIDATLQVTYTIDGGSNLMPLPPKRAAVHLIPLIFQRAGIFSVGVEVPSRGEFQWMGRPSNESPLTIGVMAAPDKVTLVLHTA